MAPKHAPKGEATATTETTVIDRIDHDGEAYEAGDFLYLTVDQARQLRSLGVVDFSDPAPAPEAPAA